MEAEAVVYPAGRPAYSSVSLVLFQHRLDRPMSFDFNWTGAGLFPGATAFDAWEVNAFPRTLRWPNLVGSK